MRSLYEPGPLLKEHKIKVGTTLTKGPYKGQHHILSVRELGNPNGISAVFFHGGPGIGCDEENDAGYFDPKKYRIILIDQRGAGESTPKGCMEENNTDNLIQDMENVRKYLNIDKWVILGGSWGSTLALLYAESFPQRVHALVLRGIFLGREQDTIAFLHEDCTAARLHPEDWTKFETGIAQLLKRSRNSHLLLGPDVSKPKDYYINVINELLQPYNPPDIREKAAGIFAQWENDISILRSTQLDEQKPDEKKPEEPKPLTEDDINMGLTEITFMKNRWFLMTENRILDGAHVIRKAKIPVIIVHGHYDIVCHSSMAGALQAVLDPSQVTRYRTRAGHSRKEPENISAVVQATDEIAEKLMPSSSLTESRHFWLRAGGVAATVATGLFALRHFLKSSALEPASQEVSNSISAPTA